MNAIEQLFLFVEQLDQLEVCLPYSRLLTGITALQKGTTARWYSNKTSLTKVLSFTFDFYIFIVDVALFVLIVFN